MRYMTKPNRVFSLLGRWSSLLLVAAMLGGCSALPRQPVPLNIMDKAVVAGIPEARAIPGEATANSAFETDFLQLARQYLASDARTPVHALALSGGGDYGAFGAGVLVGWTHAGTRPSFNVVTGISTGAIMATFAFLGPAYDATLRDAYTTISAENVYRGRTISLFWSDALTDSTPLVELIHRFVNDDVVAAVARAYHDGRRLYVGTTNLDADRLVIWNMGAIAAHGRPDLFRKILLASAAIPGVFPPVMIKVQADGHPYDEMHVDGGVKAQMFLMSTILDIERLRSRMPSVNERPLPVTIYAIRNAKTGPEPAPVRRTLADISTRALSSALRTQGVHDLLRAYQLAHDNGVRFRWVSLPDDYRNTSGEDFDRVEMNRLFDIGYRLGIQGGGWHDEPPIATP